MDVTVPKVGVLQPVTQVGDDGNSVIGSKSDAAATDSTSSWSFVALFKGILAQLLSTNPVQTFEADTYANIVAGTAATLVKTGAGTLKRLCINTKGASANTIKVYDGLSAAGTLIATIDGTSDRDHNYDVAFGTGLTIVSATGTGADMTVVYR
jgi:hypothetical protein